MRDISSIGRTWSKAREELFTPEENAASDLRVDLIGEIIRADRSAEFLEEDLET